MGRAASIAICGMVALATVPATTAAAPPGDNCGPITGPRWTAPGHRSGRLWDVNESGTSCPAAKYFVARILREHPDRRGRLRPPRGNTAFRSCSVDVRHRDIHPYATGACTGDRVGISWGIYPV